MTGGSTRDRSMSQPDTHAETPIVTGGADLDDAEAAVVLIHGRGATAQSILELGGEFEKDGVALLAPQAQRNTWYPNSFLAPIESNEPHLSSALGKVASVLEQSEAAGIPTERTLLLGFSQGACLASEFVIRHPTEYGGLVAFSGGLIGPEGTEWNHDGSLAETPVFLGCSDTDPHIPEERVHETAAVLSGMGADVEERIYEGMGHQVNQDELEYARGMVADLRE